MTTPSPHSPMPPEAQHAAPSRTLILLGVGLITLFALGIVALLLVRASLTSAPAVPANANGITVIDPPQPLTDFTLPGKDGAPLALSDLRGAHTLLFFGYTHCPDFCPITLSEFRRVKGVLAESAPDTALNVLFVSVDGERDTPAVLRPFVERFDPAFYAMQGDAVVLDGVAAEYELIYALIRDGETTEDYPVEHTTSSYVIDPAGNLAAVVNYGTEPADIAAFIAGQP